MLVQDIMLLNVYTCRDTDPAIDCAKLMRDEKIGFVPILSADDEVIGVVTDRDLAVRLVAEALPLSTPVRQVMSPGPLLTVRPEDDLRSLEELMAAQKKGRAMVLDQRGKLVGVVSLADVAGAETNEKRAARVFRDVTARESVQILKH